MATGRMTRAATRPGPVARGEDGVVLPSVILVLFVVGTLVFSMLTVSMLDTSRSGRSATRMELRGAAESELDRVFALSVQDPDLFLNLEDPDVRAARSLDGHWYESNWSNDYKDCSNVHAVCVRTALATKQLEGRLEWDLDGRINEVLVEVEVSARCDAQSTGAGGVTTRTGCMTVKYQQRLRRRQFFDYVQFTDSEALAPSRYPVLDGSAATVGSRAWAEAHCGEDAAGRTKRATGAGAADSGAGPRDDECAVVAYQGARPDLVAGPIHTNDASAYVCVPESGPDAGQRVEFAGRLTTTGSEPVVPVPESVTGGGCRATGSRDELADAVDATGRGVFERVAALELPSPTDFAVLREIAERDGTSFGAGSVVIDGSGITVDGAPRSLPDGGVVYLAGDARVSQAAPLAGRLTIVSEGAMTVESDLTVAGIDDDWDATDPQAMGAAGADRALGLVAAGDIDVACDATPAGPADPSPCADRTLHAVLMSVDGVIYSDGWNPLDSPVAPAVIGRVDPAADAPTLRIFGSVISRYRGVFGAYNPLDAGAGVEPGALVQGFRKEFVYDPRLRSSQPPYLLQPVQAAWERLDLVEVPPRRAGLLPT